jgi:arsenical pump membrane protein
MNGAFTGALEQAWPPFVLVTGLLLIGVAAASDGLFEAVGSRIARLPGGGLALFAALMALVAAVTAVLNLDTSVVFLTPVLLHAARRRGVSEIAFLYGAVFMSNSASLLLPGSNLTNLLVLSHSQLSGGAFAARLFPSWIAAVVVTSGVVVIWRWSDLRVPETGSPVVAPFRSGLGLPAVVVAAVLVLTLHNPAIPVLVLGVVVATVQVARDGRLDHRRALRAIGAPTLVGLFALVVALGTLARSWGAPGRLMASIGAWPSALLGAGTADAVNNLPAAVLLASRPPAHPEALLIGLDLGPNLVVTGALSAILWLRIARHEGAKPSAWTYTKVGAVLVPLSMAAALGALDFFGHP